MLTSWSSLASGLNQSSWVLTFIPWPNPFGIAPPLPQSVWYCPPPLPQSVWYSPPAPIALITPIPPSFYIVGCLCSISFYIAGRPKFNPTVPVTGKEVTTLLWTISKWTSANRDLVAVNTVSAILITSVQNKPSETYQKHQHSLWKLSTETVFG